MNDTSSIETNQAQAFDAGALYERALTLIETQGQLYWLVFGAFLLAETVLLGGLASIAEGPQELLVGGAVLGLLLALPWWASYRYGSAMYHLRIMQARELEPVVGTFLTEGQKLIDGQTVHGITMSTTARMLPPRIVNASLIIAFAAAFALLGVYAMGSGRLQQSALNKTQAPNECFERDAANSAAPLKQTLVGAQPGCAEESQGQGLALLGAPRTQRSASVE